MRRDVHAGEVHSGLCGFRSGLRRFDGAADLAEQVELVGDA